MDTQTRETLDTIKEHLATLTELRLFEPSELLKNDYTKSLRELLAEGKIGDFTINWDTSNEMGALTGTLYLKFPNANEFIELKMDVHPVGIKQDWVGIVNGNIRDC